MIRPESESGHLTVKQGKTYDGYLTIFDGSEDGLHELKLDVVWFWVGEVECVRSGKSGYCD